MQIEQASVHLSSVVALPRPCPFGPQFMLNVYLHSFLFLWLRSCVPIVTSFFSPLFLCLDAGLSGPLPLNPLYPVVVNVHA